jgi:hypothetical protein
MIDINKKYTTRDGREVRIYATDGLGYHNVHGAVLCCDGWVSTSWNKDGMYNTGQQAYPLIEAWVPKDKEPVWCWESPLKLQRVLGFWNAKNNCVFKISGERDGSRWDHYAKVENVEQWMSDIQAKLED